MSGVAVLSHRGVAVARHTFWRCAEPEGGSAHLLWRTPHARVARSSMAEPSDLPSEAALLTSWCRMLAWSTQLSIAMGYLLVAGVKHVGVNNCSSSGPA